MARTRYCAPTLPSSQSLCRVRVLSGPTTSPLGIWQYHSWSSIPRPSAAIAPGGSPPPPAARRGASSFWDRAVMRPFTRFTATGLSSHVSLNTVVLGPMWPCLHKDRSFGKLTGPCSTDLSYTSVYCHTSSSKFILTRLSPLGLVSSTPASSSESPRTRGPTSGPRGAGVGVGRYLVRGSFLSALPPLNWGHGGGLRVWLAPGASHAFPLSHPRTTENIWESFSGNIEMFWPFISRLLRATIRLRFRVLGHARRSQDHFSTRQPTRKPDSCC